jgi:hypothetical protein
MQKEEEDDDHDYVFTIEEIWPNIFVFIIIIHRHIQVWVIFTTTAL